MNRYLGLGIVLIVFGFAIAFIRQLCQFPTRPLPKDPVIGQDQQPQPKRGASVREIRAQQQAHRGNGTHVDPFGMDSFDPPRGRL